MASLLPEQDTESLFRYQLPLFVILVTVDHGLESTSKDVTSNALVTCYSPSETVANSTNVPLHFVWSEL